MRLHGTLGWASCTTGIAEGQAVFWLDSILGVIVVPGVLFAELDDVLVPPQDHSLLLEEFLLLLGVVIKTDNSFEIY